MALVITDEGTAEALDLLSGAWGDMTIGLYAAAHTPSQFDTYFTYASIEASFPGYARQTLTHWLPALVVPELLATTRADMVTWTRTAGGSAESIYGYFVLLETGTVFWAEADPNGPVPINANGDTYQVSPFFGLNQG